MKRRLRTYRSDDIVVEYDPRRCIHSAECVRGLPTVFDPRRVPWIEPTRADAEAIARAIERCPTGALHYRREDDGPSEPPDTENVARVGHDGPVYVRGLLRIELPDGAVLEETRAAFCRCGASRNKPFCDDSHVDVGFRDDGAIKGGRLVPLEEIGDDVGGGADGTAGTGGAGDTAGTGDADGAVTFRCSPNGSLRVRGPLRIEGTDGSVSAGHKGSLCRCGHSSTKPFCDGSHREAGFEAD